MQENEMAVAALGFCSNLLCHNHQGVIDCGDKIVIYCNGVRHQDSDSLIDTIRAYLEEEGLDEGIEVARATDTESKNVWALVATNYKRQEVDLSELNNLLWVDRPIDPMFAVYKNVQYVPVGKIAPHWENHFYRTEMK